MSSHAEEVALEAEQFSSRTLSPAETLRHSTAHLMASAIAMAEAIRWAVEWRSVSAGERVRDENCSASRATSSACDDIGDSLGIGRLRYHGKRPGKGRQHPG